MKRRLPEDASLEFKVKQEALEIALSVGSLEPPVCDAPTTYFRALRPEPFMVGAQASRASHDERMALDAKALTGCLPNLTVIDVKMDHFGILRGRIAVPE